MTPSEHQDEIDPEAPATPAGKRARAEQDLDRLLHTTLATSLACLTLCVVVDWLVHGAVAGLTRGFALGAGLASLNLWLLGRALLALAGETRTSMMQVALPVGAFIALLVAASVLGRVHPDWVVGFGLGIAIPALAGVVYALKHVSRDPPADV